MCIYIYIYLFIYLYVYAQYVYIYIYVFKVVDSLLDSYLMVSFVKHIVAVLFIDSVKVLCYL